MDSVIFASEARHIATLVFRDNINGIKVHLSHLRIVAEHKELKKYSSLVNSFVHLWKGDSINRQRRHKELRTIPLYTQLGLLTLAEAVELNMPLASAYAEVRDQFTPLYLNDIPQTWEAFNKSLDNLCGLSKALKKQGQAKLEGNITVNTPGVCVPDRADNNSVDIG